MAKEKKVELKEFIEQTKQGHYFVSLFYYSEISVLRTIYRNEEYDMLIFY